MTTLYLIRHGQTDNNLVGCYNGCKSNQPLNALGMRQAAALTAPFAKIRPDVIYASTLCRAVMTAEGVRGTREMPIHTVYELREMDMGDLDGVTFAETRANWPEIWHNWHEEPEKLQMPNGESFTDARLRAAAAISRIVRENRGKCIAVVAHGSLLSLAVSHFFGLPLAGRYEVPYLPNASYHSLAVEDDGHFSAIAFRCCDHLVGELLSSPLKEGNAAALSGRFFYPDFAKEPTP
ncbi:MAG: histidine phosphatase family protein [Clostridia bacterium]|nr:histidine phosphatase family protein [Clostridia bacterium]